LVVDLAHDHGNDCGQKARLEAQQLRRRTRSSPCLSCRAPRKPAGGQPAKVPGQAAKVAADVKLAHEIVSRTKAGEIPRKVLTYFELSAEYRRRTRER